MKWYKRDVNESRKPHVFELYHRHGFPGLFFWSRLNDLLAECFNFWCPGCYRFKPSIFYAVFQPQIKDPRTIKKMLIFLNSDKILTVSIGGRELYLYYPDIIERAAEYTTRRLRRAEERGEEQPETARDIAFCCAEMQSYNASDVHLYARDSIENKRVKH